MKTKLILIILVFNFLTIVLAQHAEPSVREAVLVLTELKGFNDKAKDNQKEELRFLSTQLLKLDKFDRIEVQENILKLIVEIEERDKDKGYWEGHPMGIWLRLVYSTVLCDENDLMKSTDNFRDIEWINYIRSNPTEVFGKNGLGKNRAELLHYLQKNNLTGKFTGNLLSCPN